MPHSCKCRFNPTMKRTTEFVATASIPAGHANGRSARLQNLLLECWHGCMRCGSCSELCCTTVIFVRAKKFHTTGKAVHRLRRLCFLALRAGWTASCQVGAWQSGETPTTSTSLRALRCLRCLICTGVPQNTHLEFGRNKCNDRLEKCYCGSNYAANLKR